MKPVLVQDCLPGDKSPPARGRGLKQMLVLLLSNVLCVAPRAGAWIETA